MEGQAGEFEQMESLEPGNGAFLKTVIDRNGAIELKSGLICQRQHLGEH